MAATLGGEGDAPPTDAHAAAAALVRAGCAHVLVTRGALGVLWARAADEAAATAEGAAATAADDGRGAPPAKAAVVFEELPAVPVSSVVSTRGAGDSFVAGAAWSLSRGTPAAPADRATAAAAAMPSGGGVLADDVAVREALRCGLRAASLALQTDAAVPAELHAPLLA